MTSFTAKPPAVGVAFRVEAHQATIQHLSEFNTLEVTADHYLFGGRKARNAIRELRERVPLVVHGVGLSVGTAVPPDRSYLDQIAGVIELTGSPWYSEHLAFTKVPGKDLAQLLPLPRTRTVAEVVVNNLAIVRRHVRVPILLENITYYFEYPDGELSELDFIELVLRESGSYLLLDLENLYINACNHAYDPYEFIDAIPRGTVKGVHVAGGIQREGLLIDSHDQPVPDPVFGLLRHLLERETPDTIIVERDQGLSAFDEVVEDVRQVRQALESCSSQHANEPGRAS